MLLTLEEHLLDETLIIKACREYNKERRRRSGELLHSRPKLEKRLIEIRRAKRSLLVLLDGGVEPDEIRNRLLELDAEERSKRELLERTPDPEASFQPGSAEPYREIVKHLRSVSAPELRNKNMEIMTAVRELVEAVIVYPQDEPEGRDVEMVGDIAALVAGSETGMKTMVAGAGFEPATFRL